MLLLIWTYPGQQYLPWIGLWENKLGSSDAEEYQAYSLNDIYLLEIKYA